MSFAKQRRKVKRLSTSDTVQQATNMFYSSRAHVLRHVAGARTFQHGLLKGYHYDKPLWWETDAFQAVNVDPAEVVRLVNKYNPGAHLIGVVTTDPGGIVPSYRYTTTASEPMEILMARSLTDSRHRRRGIARSLMNRVHQDAAN